MAEFKREDRYVVLKRKDLERLPVLLQETLWKFLDDAEFSLPQRQYVVVESDWPEYEAVFKMIEARVTGESGFAGFGIQQPVAWRKLNDDGETWSLFHQLVGWKDTTGFEPLFAAAGAAPVPEGWQPIETAPKDGTDILILHQGLARIGFFDKAKDGVWSIWPGRATASPTHWMQLPPAPKEPT